MLQNLGLCSRRRSPVHHISISIYQRKSKCKLVVFSQPKKWDSSGKRKTAAQDAALRLKSSLAWTRGSLQPWVRIKITRLWCQGPISTGGQGQGSPETSINMVLTCSLVYCALVISTYDNMLSGGLEWFSRIKKDSKLARVWEPDGKFWKS